LLSQVFSVKEPVTNVLQPYAIDLCSGMPINVIFPGGLSAADLELHRLLLPIVEFEGPHILLLSSTNENHQGFTQRVLLESFL